MGIRSYIIALACVAQPLLADVSGDYSCYGVLPDWSLTTDGTTADFAFGEVLNMDIMQDGYAEGSSATRAMTLVGGRQTAIVVLKSGQCRINTRQFPVTATVLTQQLDDPIILEGCCAPRR